MQDLQNELKSLKSLLLSRTSQRSFAPGTGLSLPTSTPASSTTVASTSGGSAVAEATVNGGNESGAETATSTTEVVSSAVPSRPRIPAWQLAAREKVQQAAKGEDEDTPGS